MSDHATCDERINKALATGHPGFAEFLATRCDLYHRREREAERAKEEATP